MADYKKYLDMESQGTTDFVPEAYGYLVDLQSPEEQGLEDMSELELADGNSIDVPTGWKAIIMTEDGEVAWRWPAYQDKKTKVCDLGLNIIRPKKTKLRALFNKRSCWHFYRDDNRRAHVEPAEEE